MSHANKGESGESAQQNDELTGVEHCHFKASLLRRLLSAHASPPGAFLDRHAQETPAEASKPNSSCLISRYQQAASSFCGLL